MESFKSRVQIQLDTYTSEKAQARARIIELEEKLSNSLKLLQKAQNEAISLKQSPVPTEESP